jgi:hypothetical protein
MQQRKKISLPSLPVKRIPLATTTNTPSKKLIQDEQQQQHCKQQINNNVTPVKQHQQQITLAITPELLSKAVTGTTTTTEKSKSPLNKNDSPSSSSSDVGLTFASPEAAATTKKNKNNHNEPIYNLRKDENTTDNDSRFELTENEDDGLTPPPQAAAQKKVTKTTTILIIPQKDASTNTSSSTLTENEEILHLQAQIRRLHQENSRLSEESTFFRSAANSMKQNTIFAKQQLMSQLEFFCEPMFREQIILEREHAMNDTFKTLFDLERFFLIDMKQELHDEKKSLEKENEMLLKKIMSFSTTRKTDDEEEEQKENNPVLSLLQNQNDSLKQELKQTTIELSQLQSSVKEMCRSWQERFNVLKTEKASLETTLETVREELVAVKNVSDFRSRRKAEQQRKFVDASVDVHRENLFEEMQHVEAKERKSFLVEQENAQRNIFSLLFENSNHLVKKMNIAKREADKSIATFSAEAAKYKQRCDRVTSECDRLVEENGKLHQELKTLRKEIYSTV